MRYGRWPSDWLRTSRTGCSGALALAGVLSAASPLRNGTRHPEIGNDCAADVEPTILQTLPHKAVPARTPLVPLGCARIRHTASPGIIQYPAPYQGHPRTRVKGSQHTLASANARCPRPWLPRGSSAHTWSMTGTAGGSAHPGGPDPKRPRWPTGSPENRGDKNGGYS